MKIALDWTPNPVHCGLFTAISRDWFAKANIALDIVSPADDTYAITPADKLRKGMVHLAIVPPEEILVDQVNGQNQLVPLRALFQYNATCMAVLNSSNIGRPADLDGKNYALLDLPWEKEIVTHMVVADGGKGDINWVRAPKLQTYEMLYSGLADCAWIFEPIEGVEAKHKNIDFRVFRLEDYGIPYGPTTILSASANAFALNKGEIEEVLNIIEAGYSLAHMEPETAAKAIFNHPLNTYYQDWDLLMACQQAALPYLNDAGEWGKLNMDSLHNYKKWVMNNVIEANNSAFSQ